MDTNDYINLSEQSIANTQRKVKEEINKYMRKEDIKLPYGEEITSTTKEIHKKTGNYYHIPKRQECIKEYEELSKGKIKGSAFRQSVKYAEIIYQPTTRALLELKERNNVLVTIAINSTLPEHAQAYANYWIGQVIESETFNEQLQDFRNKMKALRIARIRAESRPEEGKVTSIKVRTEHL